MTISNEELKKLAKLAKLHIQEDELEKYSTAFGSVLDLIDQLQAADTTDVEPLANPLDAVQVLRRDQVTEVNEREHLQQNAPAVEQGLFLVPKVID